MISREAHRAGFKVALSGLGADEVFAGYETFRHYARLERVASVWGGFPAPIKQACAAAVTRVGAKDDRSRKMFTLISGDGAASHPYVVQRMLFSYSQILNLLRHYDSNAFLRARRPLLESLGRARGMDAVNRLSYLELRNYLQNTLLRDSDAMSMAHSLEVRLPFLDQMLVSYMFCVPGEYKVANGFPKPLLVKALQGELPDEIVHRCKRGFTFPFEHWLRGELRYEMERVLVKSEGWPLAGAIDVANVQHVWNEFLERRTSWSRPWALYVLGKWYEQNF